MRGVVCDTDPRVRDEAPAAYKDLTTVMANQVAPTVESFCSWSRHAIFSSNLNRFVVGLSPVRQHEQPVEHGRLVCLGCLEETKP